MNERVMEPLKLLVIRARGWKREWGRLRPIRIVFECEGTIYSPREDTLLDIALAKDFALLEEISVNEDMFHKLGKRTDLELQHFGFTKKLLD